MQPQLTSPILEKLENTRDLPTVPAVLLPLLRYMEQPLDKVEVQEIVNLISLDKSLAGRCLQVANSPLFGSSHEVESIQTAVVALGLDRIQQIAISCSLLRLMPTVLIGVNPSVFWAHSLGCALVCREFAERIGYAEPAKAYAAGLLHDIGILAILWVAPHDFRRCFDEASSQRIPLHEAEEKILGITHCESGQIMAGNWHVSTELTDVITGHHSLAPSKGNHALTSIVSVSDLLCRHAGLGYGYSEHKQAEISREPAFLNLAARYPALRPFDLARFTVEMNAVIEEVRGIVGRIYGTH